MVVGSCIGMERGLNLFGERFKCGGEKVPTWFRCELTTVFKGGSGSVYVAGIEYGTDEKGKETVAVEETPLSPDEITSGAPVSSAKADKAVVPSSEKDEIVSVEKMV
jgi:hypothetical protein